MSEPKKKLTPEEIAELQRNVVLVDRRTEFGYQAMASGLSAPVKKTAAKSDVPHDTK